MTSMQKSRTVYLFYAIALLIPVAFFLLLELGLRWFDYGDDLSLFVTPPDMVGNGAYWVTNPKVAKRYFPKGYFTPIPPEEYFFKEKPENGYRIFVMGGSTAASWPYPRNVLFSRILGQRLSDTFPDKYIEVINTGIAAVNTFTLMDLLDEILAQDPDAILIYAGHNEFYGALGAGSTQSVGQSRWMIKTYLGLSRLKIFQFIRNLVDSTKFALKSVDEGEISGHSTLMGQVVGDNSIALGSETYQNARRNFEDNLTEILLKIKTAGVDVMVSELVSNLRDHPPFMSMNDGEQLPADLIYTWAKQLESEGMHDMARQAYTWAKDKDGLRFRASEEFNESLHKVAAAYGVPVVPMKSYFETASRNGIVGNKLMLEHLHPNADGYMLMSEAFFHTLRQEGFIANTWPSNNLKPDQYYRQVWPVTELDRALGEVRIINLTDNYPYKPKKPGERTIANYSPRNLAEELAIKTFKRELSFPQAHIHLARYYESQNQLGLAYREYQALMAAAPYNPDFYLLASEHLLKRKMFDQALPLLHRSLELKQTGYAYKWIGQALMAKGQPEAARRYLETALSYFAEDVFIIYSLGLIKLAEDDTHGAMMTLKLLERIAPDSEQTVHFRKIVNQHTSNALSER